VTSIRFGLPTPAIVRIDVYNILGSKVSTILNEYRTAGYHVVRFDASDLASGTYVYRISAGRYNEVRKMVLLR
jgi:hypothetical protein